MLESSRMLVVVAVSCALLAGCNESAETADTKAPTSSVGAVESVQPPAAITPAPVTPAVPSGGAQSSVTQPGASNNAQPPVTPAAPSGGTQQIVTDGSTTGAAPTDLASRPIPAAASNEGTMEVRIGPTSSRGYVSDGVGAFREVCGYSHMAFDDPIVFPGQPGASHLHTFFGNTTTDGNTTTETLSAGSSTCAGGSVNRSSYWVPALVDSTTMRAVVPVSFMVYYKSGYNAIPLKTIQAPPNGLRMLAGNSPMQSSRKDSYSVKHQFDCGAYMPDQQSIPLCRGGETLYMHVEFPNCWDGVNLDSVDHRSHMSYPDGSGKCPASHPIPISDISLNIGYQVPNGMTSANWRLASDNYPTTTPAGYSMHGDVWIDWDEDIKETWMTSCVRAGIDCNAYLLGDGRTLY